MCTQDFTTPQFASTLNKQGIEINSPFVWCNVNGKQLLGIVVGNEFIELQTGDRHELDSKSDLVAAYPLTQVLRWLPKHLTSNNYLHSLTGERIDGNQWWGYGRQDPNTVSGTIAIICFVPLSPIEDLVTQGLHEGWLTKDMILNALKSQE